MFAGNENKCKAPSIRFDSYTLVQTFRFRIPVVVKIIPIPDRFAVGMPIAPTSEYLVTFTDKGMDGWMGEEGGGE